MRFLEMKGVLKMKRGTDTTRAIPPDAGNSMGARGTPIDNRLIGVFPRNLNKKGIAAQVIP